MIDISCTPGWIKTIGRHVWKELNVGVVIDGGEKCAYCYIRFDLCLIADNEKDFQVNEMENNSEFR